MASWMATCQRWLLGRDDRVIFAYLYGSMLTESEGNDIDIAVFPKSEADPHLLAADLKIALHRKTGLPPDHFDVRVLSEPVEKVDIFSHLYLKNVLETGKMVVNKAPECHADFWRFLRMTISIFLPMMPGVFTIPD